MTIIEDTRNKRGKHDAKHAYFAEAGVDVFRSKLPVGDYSVAGSTVSVDTKADLFELHGNLTGQHERFRAECQLAQRLGITLVVLVENTHGVRSLAGLRGRVFERQARGRCVRIKGDTTFKICQTMEERYGVEFRFCKPQEAGEILVGLFNSSFSSP